MKQIISLLILILFYNNVIGQSTRILIKDLDRDAKKDTVYIDSDSNRIFCLLSTNNYKETNSESIRILNFGNTLVATTNGFEFWNNYNRSEYINEFEFNSDVKKMQLIKMTRKEYNWVPKIIAEKTYRRATIGKSTINLLTNQYLGEFMFYENYNYGTENIGETLPKIKTKMIFPETYLETFSDAINYEYEKKCVELLEKNVGERNNN